MNEIDRPMPRPTAQVVPYVEALGPDLAVTFLLENGGAELYLGSVPNRLLKKSSIMVFAAILALHVAFRDRKKLHLGSLDKPKTLFQQPAKGRSRLEIMVGPDRAKALAGHPAMQMKQRVPLASKWLARMLHWQGLSTAEIARQVRASDTTVRRWVKEAKS